MAKAYQNDSEPRINIMNVTSGTTEQREDDSQPNRSTTE